MARLQRRKTSPLTPIHTQSAHFLAELPTRLLIPASHAQTHQTTLLSTFANMVRNLPAIKSRRKSLTPNLDGFANLDSNQQGCITLLLSLGVSTTTLFSTQRLCYVYKNHYLAPLTQKQSDDHLRKLPLGHLDSQQVAFYALRFHALLFLRSH